MVVLMRSDRFPTEFGDGTWSPISSTPWTYFDGKAGAAEDIFQRKVTCNLDSDGAFTLRFMYNGRTSDTGFRYNPKIQRRKASRTCNAITPEHGDWERMDVRGKVVKYYERLEILPDAPVPSSSTVVSDDALMIYYVADYDIVYTHFSSTRLLNEISKSDLVKLNLVSNMLL